MAETQRSDFDLNDDLVDVCANNRNGYRFNGPGTEHEDGYPNDIDWISRVNG